MNDQSRKVVLVVEDEPILRMLAVDLVEDAGFKAIEAANAEEAVTILEDRTDIKILFTDINMPGPMNGMKLAAVVRRRWPPIGIIITSGYFSGVQVIMPDRGVFFAKPYDVDQVTAELYRLAP